VNYGDFDRFKATESVAECGVNYTLATAEGNFAVTPAPIILPYCRVPVIECYYHIVNHARRNVARIYNFARTRDNFKVFFGPVRKFGYIGYVCS
jgi:hypothetical protein